MYSTSDAHPLVEILFHFNDDFIITSRRVIGSFVAIVPFCCYSHATRTKTMPKHLIGNFFFFFFFFPETFGSGQRRFS